MNPTLPSAPGQSRGTKNVHVDEKRGPRPVAPVPNLDAIPAELKARPQWVCWWYFWKGNGWTKVPRLADRSANASTTDPSTWCTFETAVDAYRRRSQRTGSDRLDGIGFVFSPDDPYVGVDLDYCLDDLGGSVEWAKPFLDRLFTYGEVSPSGRGIKFVAMGKLPGDGHKRNGFGDGTGAVEMYDQARFFTITGRHVAEFPETVVDLAETIVEIHAEVWPAKPAPAPAPRPAPTAAALPDDDVLIERARRAKNGAAFSALFDRGDTSAHNGDDSAADLALCNWLAFWFQRDPTAMDRVFRRSALMREKWDEKRGETTYGAMTIALAIEGTAKVYEPPAKPSTATASTVASTSTTAGPTPSTNGDGHAPARVATEQEAPADVATPEPHEADDDPHRLARVYLDAHCNHPNGSTLGYWNGEFTRWGLAWRTVGEREIQGELATACKAEFDRLNAKEIQAWEASGRAGDNGKPARKPVARKVSKSLVGNVALALGGYSLIAGKTRQPSWLIDNPPFSAVDVLPCRNALVYLPGIADGRATTCPPTPGFFCPYVLDYDFHPDAEAPAEWFRFLTSLWPDDEASTNTLQEWMGYLLTPDTRQQKILMMIGPKRSGKGTIARVFHAMLGAENVASPTLASLGTNFGLAPLIGKPAATITDARLSGRADIAQIVERLLSISGEDGQTIDRKHLPAVTVKLPTRFTLISNELPRLTEMSGALAGRMIVLRLTESFYGREDHDLERRLMLELPGILLWAIEGWKRLRDRGRFVQPESGRQMVEELEELASPIGMFVKESCAVGPLEEVPIKTLFDAWCVWCKEKNRDHVGDMSTFGRNLRTVIPKLETKPVKKTVDGKSTYYRGFVGINLKIAF